MCECQLSLSLSLIKGPRQKKHTLGTRSPPPFPLVVDTPSRSLSLFGRSSSSISLPPPPRHPPPPRPPRAFKMYGGSAPLPQLLRPPPPPPSSEKRTIHHCFTPFFKRSINKFQKIAIDIKILLEHGESAPFSASPPPQCPPKSPLLLRCAAAVEEAAAFIAEKKYKWGEEGALLSPSNAQCYPPPLCSATLMTTTAKNTTLMLGFGRGRRRIHT